MGLFPLLLSTAAALASSATQDGGLTASTVVRFRTDAEPRVDAVFADALTLRRSIDRFFTLYGEMESVRTEFSTAVHDTLSLLPGSMPSQPAVKAPRATARQCPDAVGPTYGRALAAGARYLRLGRQLESASRDIKRGDELGDIQGLTPDYRLKSRRARDLYGELLRDLREMRVAFYDQLGAELRHAGCRLGSAAVAPLPGDVGGVAAPVDPSNPAAWELASIEAPPAEPETGKPAVVARNADQQEPETAAARAIWIDVDNTHCPLPSRITIDGAAVGDVPAGKKISVRTRAGPREVCLLPSTDKRACGAAGTVRRTYFYEGLALTVHCGR